MELERRPYRLKARAERQAATRQRIIEAAVELHASIGPAQTSISAIAERAGVQRHTVYAHFPDDQTLFRACWSHWREHHPFPDLEGLDFQKALDRIYRWYEAVDGEFALFRKDAELYPDVWAERERALAAVADRLAASVGHGDRKSV